MSRNGESILEVRGLRAGYGQGEVVRSVSLSVCPGEVYALLGRNGAGKSTLIRCLLGHLRPDAGRSLLFGRDAWRERARLMDRVGVVPEGSELPPRVRVDQLSAYCAELHAHWDEAGLRDRLARFGIPWRAEPGALSRGQQTRLALALAMASRPELLVLDDPTLGLDPLARRSFYEELSSELAGGRTSVFVATHDLAGIEGFADRVGILKEGELILDEPLEGVKERFRRLRWAGPEARPADLDAWAPLRVEEHPWGWEALVSRFTGELQSGFEAQGCSLEDLFIALVDDRKEVLA